MAIPILATKLYIPPPSPKVISRTRLSDRLNEGLSAGHKLTLISAPAGFGKSTLVSEWLPQCGQPAVWVSLDENDHDPARFWTYFISALQKVSPNMGVSLLEILQTPQAASIEVLLTALLNEVAALPMQLTLVLDDYHIIDNRQVDEALAFFIEYLPPQIHLVITTREDPALPLHRLRARGQLTELRAANLRFTPSEAAEFLNQLMGFHLTGQEVEALETRTEGWIAGLQLAALSMKGNQDVPGFIQTFAGDHRYIADYLIEEVLHHQPDAIRNFLLQTSILERLNGSLCEAVTGEPESQAQLEALQRGNFFLIPLDDRRHWYRYHHLFAEVLRLHLVAEQPDLVDSLHCLASDWYEKNGAVNDAVRHALAARDFSRAARLAETNWQEMYESFQLMTWLGWVKELPEALVRTRPVLCTQIAWGLMDAQKVSASEARLQDAERCLEASSDGIIIEDKKQYRSLRARIAFVHAYNAQTRRDFLASVKFAEQTLELIPEEDQFLRSQTTAMLGATYLISGDLEAACRSMEDWIAHSLKIGNYFSAFAYAMVEKADILTAQGHLREALKTYQQALQLASEHDSRVLRVMAHPYLGMAMLYYEMGDDEAAEQHFEKSLELAGLHSSVDWSYRKCLAQARMKESLRDFEAALERLDEAKSFYIKTLMPHTRPLEAIKARIYLKQGRLSKAEAWVKTQKLTLDDDPIYLREFEHIILVRVMLARYQNERDEHVMLKALLLLDRLFQAAETRKRVGSMLEILVTQALAYGMMNDSSTAYASLELALTLAYAEGYYRIIVDEGEPLRRLLSDFRGALEKSAGSGNHELSEYLDKLLPTFVQAQARPSTKLIEPLSPRELEILRLFKTELSGPEIADELVIALSTLRTHTKSIYSKLNANSRRTAVKQAIELGLI